MDIPTDNVCNNWIAKMETYSNDSINMICFPFSGGGIHSFKNWHLYLENTNLAVVQYPGRGIRMGEELFTNIDEIVETMYHEMVTYLQKKPFVFFGHSLGSILAFELATRLIKKDNVYPLHLFLSGHDAPHIDNWKKPIHNLSEQGFINEIRRYNGTPQQVLENKEMMNLMLPILRADFQMIETYRFKNRPALDCPITVFHGNGDPHVKEEYAKEWAKHTDKKFTFQKYNGDHFFIFNNERKLLQHIQSELNSVHLGLY